MKLDVRPGSSVKEDESDKIITDSNEDDKMEIDEVSWSTQDDSEARHELAWTRKDYGTFRLMLPGEAGPKWSSCARRVTVDLNTGQTIEDRHVSEITGRERRRMFKSGPRNISTTFTYEALGEVSPRKWQCNECQHLGWLKTPNACEACGKIGTVKPIAMEGISVVHRENGRPVQAWGDVTGNELDMELTIKARQEEMEQFRKHGVHEKVK